MTGLTRSPLTSRGALVAIDATGPVTAVAFQYDPDEMTRTLQARTATSGAGRDPATNEALRLSGAPIETITLSVEIDAVEGLEADDPLATELGIHPQLSALEMLVYPRSPRRCPRWPSTSCAGATGSTSSPRPTWGTPPSSGACATPTRDPSRRARLLLDALDRVEVTNSDTGRSGFQLVCTAGRSGTADLIDFPLFTAPLLRAFHRVVLVVTFGGLPRVLMDGVVTHRELTPRRGRGPGRSP